ncbi:hypothetical protein BDR03DRAFT_1007547 [Suillus americanus]|nr:hypothetical protein BDR03DRAFT_1007547 [Suillus americanus]
MSMECSASCRRMASALNISVCVDPRPADALNSKIAIASCLSAVPVAGRLRLWVTRSFFAVNVLVISLQPLEHELIKSIEELTTWRRIIGAPLTADEIVDPQEERNTGEVSAYEDDDAIVAEIQHRQAIRSGELVEVESDDEDEDDPPKVCATELIPLCKKLETACIARVSAGSSLELVHRLCAFRAALRREELQNAKQATLDKFWNTK